MRIERSGTWYPNLSKIFFFVVFCLGLTFSAKSQDIIFQENFEGINPGGIGTWQSMYFGNAPAANYNVFAVQSACPTNLISGTRSMQVTGISPSGASCNYVNNPNNNAPIIVHEIDATNYEDITLSYNWKCRGEIGNDYGQLYYSLDGINYTLLENNLRRNNTNTVTVIDYVLPAGVENTTFFIGWAFRANNNNVVPPGMSIDDIVIKGISMCDPVSATAEDSVICEGAETTLNVTSSGSHTYNWYVDYNSTTNTGTLIGSGNSINVTPDENTLYAVVSDCGRYDFVSVVVIPAPTLVTPSPLEINNCESDDVIHELTMSGGLIPNEILIETFNPDSSIPWLVQTTVIGGSGPNDASWSLYASSPTFRSNDNTNFVMVDSDAYGPYTMESSLISPTFSLADYSAPINLNFYHYYRHIAGAGQTGTVEISTDLGSTWTSIQTYTSDHGAATNFALANINLNAYAGAQTVNIRFRFNATWGWYWAIDNVSITGTPNPTTITWSPEEGLYTDPNATIPYTGDSRTTVYAMPENSTTYTVTSTSSVGCETTAEVEITGGISIWDGAQWVNSISPTDDRKAVFRGDYNSLGDIEACSVLIESGDVVINSNHTLTIENGLTVNNTNGSLIIESDANLLQINPVANTGSVTVKRSATVPSNQYNYWSSPVTSQALYSLYPGIPSGKVMTYNTNTDYFNVLPAGSTSQFGKGYSIKGSNQSAHAPNVTANFIGVPQNESVTSSQNIIPLSSAGNRFNLIGNPFPSNLNLDDLYNHAPNNGAFDGTYYFWDNTNNTIMHQQGGGYAGNNYAIYNANSGGIAATGGNTAKVPNGIVKPGQGFIVQALPGASQLIVANDMRTKEVKIDALDDDAPYYKNGNNGAVDDIYGSRPRNNKFWLELVTPGEVHVQTLMGYFAQAENTFEKFDTKLLNENVSDNIYSFSKEAYKLAIQGRQGPFENTDVIPLGVKFFGNGKYKIQLKEGRGIFKNHQNIYLKDKYLNQIHNLSESFYDFEGTAGEFTDRFEIIFKNAQNTASDDAFAKTNQVNIQKINQQILISSEKDKLFSVEIFNLAGWSVYKNENVQSNELRIPAAQFGKEIIVVKVLTETGEIVTKKIINK